MKQSDIAITRLRSQQLTSTSFTTPREIVAWMGAMQAQDYPMCRWAVGVRLPGTTDLTIEAAINRAEIIRTHLLRPTWHFVAAGNVYWLLELSAPQIKSAQSSRDRELELTETVYSKSNSIIEKALSSGMHLTREELVAELNKAGIATTQNRASHLFARAEVEKIICSGASRDGKPTYALLSERVPKTGELTREEALAKLARCYFTSRCPATIQDFTWWSGLSAGDARQALEMVKPDFNPETINGRTYWMTNDVVLQQPDQPSVFLLPTFDEFLISYTDRSASISGEFENHMKEISDRGVFRPIIVVNGLVAGIWKRIIKENRLLLELEYFTKPDDIISSSIRDAATHFGNFLGKKIEMK
jgi:DNA glycosylase AlkZ-like